jgi:soluble lytic murein transglycosylase
LGPESSAAEETAAEQPSAEPRATDQAAAEIQAASGIQAAAQIQAARGVQWIAGTALITLAALVVGRQLLALPPAPTPDSSSIRLEQELRWSLDPERRRLAALLLASRDANQPLLQWQRLRGQGWGRDPLAPVALKQEALAAERLGWSGSAEVLWQQLQRRFPGEAATADALYALGRRSAPTRQLLLERFPSHPAALAAALELATDPAVAPAGRLAAAVHLAQWGPRWPGAREVLLAECQQNRSAARALPRQQLALGLARLEDGAAALSCLGQPTTSLNGAAATLTLSRSLLMAGADLDPSLATAGRQGLISLLRRWPEARETDDALRALAEDPSDAALATLEGLPLRWKDQAPVQARLALAGRADPARVLRRWPHDPASWDLRWQLARRALLQQRWHEARTLLQLPPFTRWPAPLAARQRFWLGYCHDRLGQGAAARGIWRDLVRQDGGGYYGWRASLHLGEDRLAPLTGPAETDALISNLKAVGWQPLNSGQPELERLWQAGQALEAWELWRHRRRGQIADSPDSLRLEGLLRLGIDDNGHGLEQLERASQRLKGPDCKLRQQLERGLHPLRYPNAFQAAARDSGVNAALLLGVAKAESQFMPAARSPVGAIGLLQLMPETAREVAGASLSRQTLEEPGQNSRLGARYLRQLLDRWQGELLPAVASYNAGAGAVAGWDEGLRRREPELWVEGIPYPETRLYVKKVLGNAWSYLRGARLGCEG